MYIENERGNVTLFNPFMKEFSKGIYSEGAVKDLCILGHLSPTMKTSLLHIQLSLSVFVWWFPFCFGVPSITAL